MQQALSAASGPLRLPGGSNPETPSRSGCQMRSPSTQCRACGPALDGQVLPIPQDRQSGQEARSRPARPVQPMALPPGCLIRGLLLHATRNTVLVLSPSLLPPHNRPRCGLLSAPPRPLSIPTHKGRPVSSFTASCSFFQASHRHLA